MAPDPLLPPFQSRLDFSWGDVLGPRTVFKSAALNVGAFLVYAAFSSAGVVGIGGPREIVFQLCFGPFALGHLLAAVIQLGRHRDRPAKVGFATAFALVMSWLLAAHYFALT